jgi:hypothetical protein
MTQIISTLSSTEIFIGAIMTLALATLASRWLYQKSLRFDKTPKPIWMGELMAAWAMIISGATAVGSLFFVITS